MIIGRYLQWVETAPLAARIDAARSLVDVFASPELTVAGRDDAELALFALLDDPAAQVRRALAETVARSVQVPRHLVAALAQDQSSVSVPVLRFSPLLEDADLIDAVVAGDRQAQAAVALRPLVRAAVVAALIEAGDAEVAILLCGNANADIVPAAMRRIFDRFGTEGEVREALLARGDLEAGLRHDLVVATAAALTRFAVDCDWMIPVRAEQVARETRDKGAVTIARDLAGRDGPAGPRALVAHLRASGHLTPALVLRALLSGNQAFFEAVLVELTGTAPLRVAGQVRDPSGLGFGALYAKTGLPPVLLPVFRAALQAQRTLAQDDAAGLHRGLVTQVMAVCAASRDPALARVAAMLRRFEAEALRDEARALVASAWAEDAAEAIPALLPWIAGLHASAPRLTLQSAA